jgi:hypothetical protein
MESLIEWTKSGDCSRSMSNAEGGHGIDLAYMVYRGWSIYVQLVQSNAVRGSETYLLRCRLERQHCIRRIVDLLDLLWVGDKYIAVVGSEKLERLPIRLVERLLDDLRAPKEVCPCLITLGEGFRNVPPDLEWGSLHAISTCNHARLKN